MEEELEEQDHLGSAPGPPYALPEFKSFGLKLGGRRTDSVAYALPDGTKLSHRSFESDNHWADFDDFTSDKYGEETHVGENGHSGPFHNYAEARL